MCRLFFPKFFNRLHVVLVSKVSLFSGFGLEGLLSLELLVV